METRLRSDGILEIAPEVDRPIDETSDEAFDRALFARRALDILKPERTTIAICEGASRMRIDSGPLWGQRGHRWAMLAIPGRASRRAIALAVAEIAAPHTPYALDVLMDEARAERG